MGQGVLIMKRVTFDKFRRVMRRYSFLSDKALEHVYSFYEYSDEIYKFRPYDIYTEWYEYSYLDFYKYEMHMDDDKVINNSFEDMKLKVLQYLDKQLDFFVDLGDRVLYRF
jgi:hypothetical protein